MKKQLITSKHVVSLLAVLITFTLTNDLIAAEDKVEPLGAERGNIVNVPADAADKLGHKINDLVAGKEEVPKAPTPEAKPQGNVEPLGAERGKLVDAPADAADKIGKKINALLGKNE